MPRPLAIAAFGAVVIAALFLPLQTNVEADLLSQAAPAIRKMTPPSNPDRGGTGFYLKMPAGTVMVTNGHVCEAAEDGWMASWDDRGGREMHRIIAVSEESDLCLLTAPTDVPTLELDRFQRVREKLYVVGHPLLEDNTLSSGFIVSYELVRLLDRAPEDRCKAPSRFWMDGVGCIRTVAAYTTSFVIYPGNSGSPVLSDDGRVLGVIFAGDGRTNFGAFVPLEDLRRFLQETGRL